mmetsp:Transcript_28663/g.77645  ORF Transcript_28663/g.77645 Transcript_28663/m.77645 type:complete len:99 (+) Transcript_28663:332-628(+)
MSRALIHMPPSHAKSKANRPGHAPPTRARSVFRALFSGTILAVLALRPRWVHWSADCACRLAPHTATTSAAERCRLVWSRRLCVTPDAEACGGAKLGE